MRHLSDAFPGVWFTYEGEEPPGSAAMHNDMPLFLRLWLWLFGVETRYPNHRGYFERSASAGGAAIVEFYFVAGLRVPWIRATSYGMTGGLDDNFARLTAATGWVVEYPEF